MLWWVDPGGLWDTHPAALRTEGENKIEKLMGQDKDREISYWLIPWVKQARLGEDLFNLWPIKNRVGWWETKEKPKKTFPLLLIPWLNSLIPDSSTSSPASRACGWGMGELRWVRNSSSLPLIPPHTFLLLLHVSSMGCSPSGNIRLLQHGVLPMGCGVDICSDVVFSTGWKGLSVLAPGASPPFPFSFTLVSAGLFHNFFSVLSLNGCTVGFFTLS